MENSSENKIKSELYGIHFRKSNQKRTIWNSLQKINYKAESEL